MDDFKFKKKQLFCEDHAVADLAKKFGTPLYIYSQQTILSHFNKIKQAFSEIDPLVCYSVKANSNLSILKLLADTGAGLDIVSQGELVRGRIVGVAPEKIVYAGVGKTKKEIATAIKANILMFNVESEPEAGLINKVAAGLKKTVQVAFRINPDVDAKTHKYITTGKKENKFGLSIPVAMDLFRKTKRLTHIKPVGIHMHIGSQITTVTPYLQAIEHMKKVIQQLREQGIEIQYFNIGGGLGIIYNEERPQTADEFAKAVIPLVKPLGCKLILEPGRFIVGNAGILVTEVQYVKQGHLKSFAIVDAGMNDLIRPSLYSAYHHIVTVKQKRSNNKVLTDIVGPICESGDFLGKDRHLPTLATGDLLAVRSSGAYGMVMASNYNSRPRPAEILVNGTEAKVICKRETMDDVMALELAAFKG